MPAFCVGLLHVSQANSVIQADVNTWHALRKMVGREAKFFVTRPLTLGWYQMRLAPTAATMYLSPDTMLQMATLLLSCKTVTAEQGQMLQRLQARLR